MEVLGAAASPCRLRSARYAVKGYPDYSESDVRGPAPAPASPCRPRSAGYVEKGCIDCAEPGVPAVSTPCRPRSARYAEMGTPTTRSPTSAVPPPPLPRRAGHGARGMSRRGASTTQSQASPPYPRRAAHGTRGTPRRGTPTTRSPDVCTASAPCRPRSAEKGYPNVAESDERCGRKVNGGSAPAMKPAAQDARKRRKAAADATEMAVHMVCPLLQGEETVAQGGRKWRRTAAAPMATAMAVGKVFPLPKDNGEVLPVDGGADEHGGGGGGSKSWRLRVKETLRAFSSNYLHYVQEEQQRGEAVRQELKVARALKFQANDHDRGFQGVKWPSKRPDLKALTTMQSSNAILFPEKRIGHLPGIDVGDQFSSRAEMVVLSIHGHWMNGIDYMGSKYQDKGHMKMIWTKLRKLFTLVKVETICFATATRKLNKHCFVETWH